MQSMNQTTARRAVKQKQAPMRSRRMSPDRLREVQPLDYAVRNEGNGTDTRVRTLLADAFRNLGVARHARSALARARAYYPSSGHDRTRGLR